MPPALRFVLVWRASLELPRLNIRPLVITASNHVQLDRDPPLAAWTATRMGRDTATSTDLLVLQLVIADAGQGAPEGRAPQVQNEP